ncbi:HTH domain-containing protein [Achromobacter marplatensis]|nr:hypothetical protein [Achromobacter marplatensis]
MTVLRAAWPYLKRRLAERAAGKGRDPAPTSISDKMMDDALRRLGAMNAEDPLFKRLIVGIEGKITRPDCFRKPSVREWLSIPRVRDGLKLSAERAIARGVAPADVLDRVADDYAEITGEHRSLAAGPIQIVISFLQVSIQEGVKDPAMAAVLQATSSEITRELKTGLSDLTDATALAGNRFVLDQITQDARNELDRILRRRATQGEKTTEDLRQLVGAFEKGARFFAADSALKNDAVSWLARAEANAGNGPEAKRLLDDLKQKGYVVTDAVRALVDLAQDAPTAALQRVRDLHDADSQAVMFSIIARTQGREMALQYVDDLRPLAATAFTAIGWCNVCSSLIAEGKASTAADLLERLPEEVLRECTSLYFLYAVSQLLPMFPEEVQPSLMLAGLPAVVQHALDGPESTARMTIALNALERAKHCAADANDNVIEEHCADGIQYLRLMDDRTKDEETARIVEAMKDGATAVKLVAIARSWNIMFDPQPIQDYLSRAHRLGGLNREQRKAQLLLLDTADQSLERLRFLEDEWQNLVADLGFEFLVVKKMEALVQTRDVDGAAIFLELHSDQLEEPLRTRIKLMLDNARGEDPTAAAVALFNESEAIEDLHNLVRVLESRKRWKRLAPYSEMLYRREPNFYSAMLRLRCLEQTQANADVICTFLDSTVGRVEQRPEVRSARAWAQFAVGNHAEAKRLNDELLAERDDANDFSLDVNIAVRTGDWERFRTIGAGGLERRSQLDARMLLGLAQLVSLFDPGQSLLLAQEAVAQEGDNPAILVGAHAIAIAAKRDDLAMPWVHKATELSKDGGPISSFSLREMVEFMKGNEESWNQKNEMYRTAQMPIHMAASVFTAPFSQLLIAIPRRNAREADPRRWKPVPIRSGKRAPVVPLNSSRVALDVTALFILHELGLLETTLGSLDEVFISPRLMDVLLEDRGRIAFHQPSRVAEVKPLITWIARGQIKLGGLKAEIGLATEIGEEAAALLVEAEAKAGKYVHPGPLFRVSSYMEEEADLGVMSQRIADPIDILEALLNEGLITQAHGDEARQSMDRTQRGARQAIPPNTPLYLNGASVQYLNHAKLLQPLLNSTHEVFIHKSTLEEWHALLETEPMTDELIEAVNGLRKIIRSALISGKVKFLAQNRKQGDMLNATTMLPLHDLLGDYLNVDAVVLDDRMLGNNIELVDSTGKSVPILSSLDVLDVLIRKGVLSETERREALHQLRAQCFFCIPILPDDVDFYLNQAPIEDGQLKETAELRTLRQYLARLNATDVLCTDADLTYHESLWKLAHLLIGRLWTNGSIPTNEATIKSDWIVDHVLPDLALAMRFSPGFELRIEEVAATQLSLFLGVPTADPARRTAYANWVESCRILPLLPANSQVLEFVADQAAQSLARRTLEIANELEKKYSVNSA